MSAAKRKDEQPDDKGDAFHTVPALGPAGVVSPTADFVQKSGYYNPATHEVQATDPNARTLDEQRTLDLVQRFKSDNFHFSEAQFGECARAFQRLAAENPAASMDEIAATIEANARKLWGEPPANRAQWQQDQEVARLAEIERKRRAGGGGA